MFTTARKDETVEGTMNKANTTAEDVQKAGRRVKHDLSDAANTVGDDLQDMANYAGRHVRELAGTAQESLVAYIQEQPIKTSLFALATGLVIGALFIRR